MFHVELDIRPRENTEVPTAPRGQKYVEGADQVCILLEPAHRTRELSPTESIRSPDMLTAGK